MANGFTFYAPTKIIFGSKAEEEAGKQIRAFGGSRALIVYGSERVVKDGLMGRIQRSLEREGVTYAMLGGVVPNPRLSLVYKGIELGQKEGVDFLLAVGGGSAIDTAKAIAYGLAEPGVDVWELFAHTRAARGCYPVASVPTIAAAGSEMSNSTVITNEETGDKRGYNDNACRPKFALMNPELTLDLPDYQTQSGCADIMMHTMERYFTNAGNMEITDVIAEGLLRTVMKCAETLHTNPRDHDARAEVLWASSLSHNHLTGLGNGGDDFSCHKLEHELGGMFDVTHGAGLAAVWGSWARYVYGNCLHRFVRFAVNVHGVAPGGGDEETALRGIEAQEAFFRRIGMPVSLRELGVEPTDDQIDELAVRCAKACGRKCGSARELREEDMRRIYQMAR